MCYVRESDENNGNGGDNMVCEISPLVSYAGEVSAYLCGYGEDSYTVLMCMGVG